jgi:carbonic anhydrase/acetyltransferase-like protein (isoleucine patch superfamily)
MTGLVLPYRGLLPRIDPTAFVAETATVIGDVELGANASLWYGVTVRGDVNSIRIGANSNVQDGTVVHCTYRKHRTVIGQGVLIGHACVIHGCELHDGCFIGMGAIVMDGCVVESGAMIAAGALLTPGKVVRKGELWTGRPAKFARPVSEAEAASNLDAVQRYAAMAAEYRAG